MSPKMLSALLVSASVSFAALSNATITEDLSSNMSLKDAVVNNIKNIEQTQEIVEEALKYLCPDLNTDIENASNCTAGANLLIAVRDANLLPADTDITQLALLTGINPDLVSQASAAGGGAPGAGGGGGTAGGGSSFGGAGFGSGAGGGGGNQASPQ